MGIQGQHQVMDECSGMSMSLLTGLIIQGLQGEG